MVYKALSLGTWKQDSEIHYTLKRGWILVRTAPSWHPPASTGLSNFSLTLILDNHVRGEQDNPSACFIDKITGAQRPYKAQPKSTEPTLHHAVRPINPKTRKILEDTWSTCPKNLINRQTQPLLGDFDAQIWATQYNLPTTQILLKS